MEGHHEELLDIILEALGDKVANLKEVKATSPLNEYWERGYQVVVVYHKTEMTKMEQYEGLIWHGGYIRSPWPNANTTDLLRSKLTDLSAEKRHPQAFFVLQGVLTPDGELIKNQIMDVKGVSIKGFADSCNCQFVDWITGDPDSQLKLWSKGGGDDEEGRANSITIVDFVERGSVISAVINSNRA